MDPLDACSLGSLAFDMKSLTWQVQVSSFPVKLKRCSFGLEPCQEDEKRDSSGPIPRHMGPQQVSPEPDSPGGETAAMTLMLEGNEVHV